MKLELDAEHMDYSVQKRKVSVYLMVPQCRDCGLDLKRLSSTGHSNNWGTTWRYGCPQCGHEYAVDHKDQHLVYEQENEPADGPR